MKKTKKPWYIWLSLPAFLVLLVHTSFVCAAAFLKKAPKALELNLSAVANAALLWVLCLMLPLAVLSAPLNWLNGRCAFMTEAGAACLFFAFLYAAGVFMAYRHQLWREKNLPPRPGAAGSGKKQS